MSVSRTDYTGGLDLPESRDHGVDTSIADFTDLDADAAKAKLGTLSRAERMAVLFDFDPFDYQRELIAHIDTAESPQVAIQPGRQVGKTLTGAALAADAAATMAGEDVLIAAPFQETADEMMREATSLLETAETRLAAMDMDLGVETKNKREWIFEHDGRLLSRTLGVDGVGQRGKNPRFVIVDEAAYVPDSVFEDVIEPFFTTHPTYTFILTSTPAGDAGYFYDKCQLDDDWHSPYWPTAISPLVDPEWLAERERKTESRTWRQEFLGEFIGSSDRFFTPALIDDATDHDAAGGEIVSLGADIARAGDDRTAIVGIDDSGTADVLVSDANLNLTDATGRLSRLYEQHNPDSILVDETGLGAGVVEMLQSEISERVVEGVKFTIDRKQSIYNGLKQALEAGELTLAHHPRMSRELKKLTYSLTAGGKTKITHPDNGHDDHPDALALAADGYGGRVESDEILAFQL
ncbi:terminase large subunit [environmental Halophage eHP-32]|nr:terminase large subunit [environmental Halophage eHP-32]